MTRDAFGAEFVGADGFLDTPTVGIPPRFVTSELRDCVRLWEQGRLQVGAFDQPMAASRSAYAALTGVDEHCGQPFASGDVWSSLYGLPMQLANDARRFDSSPVWFSVLGAGLSLPWMASLDQAAVETHTVKLAKQLRAELGLAPADSAIVSIPAAHPDSLRNAGISASVRDGAVRVGFHQCGLRGPG